jgi:hypothetical protein
VHRTEATKTAVCHNRQGDGPAQTLDLDPLMAVGSSTGTSAGAILVSPAWHHPHDGVGVAKDQEVALPGRRGDTCSQ